MDRDDIRLDMGIHRKVFCEWSPLLKGDMVYVFGKWKQSFKKTKAKQKKQVQKWFDTVWEGNEYDSDDFQEEDDSNNDEEEYEDIEGCPSDEDYWFDSEGHIHLGGRAWRPDKKSTGEGDVETEAESAAIEITDREEEGSSQELFGRGKEQSNAMKSSSKELFG